MPLYKVEVFKRLGTEEWTNRYFITAGSMAAAIPISGGITAAEILFHSDQVTFTYTRTSTVVEGDAEFHNEPHNVNGSVPGSTTGGLLPLWNVVKVYLTKGYSRPDYKLYRGVIGEANSESGTVSVGTRTVIANAIAGMIDDEPPYLVDESGDLILDQSVDPLIRQRDLHRRRRSGSTPPLSMP